MTTLTTLLFGVFAASIGYNIANLFYARSRLWCYKKTVEVSELIQKAHERGKIDDMEALELMCKLGPDKVLIREVVLRLKEAVDK